MNISENKNNMQDIQDEKLSAKLRRYFFAGLVTILPLWLTLYILWVVFKLISNVTRPFLAPLFAVFFGRDPVTFLVQISSFILTLAIVLLVGLLATDIAGKKVLFSVENMIIRIPLLRNVYLSVRKLTQYVFTKKSQYRQVALIEWPRKGLISVGFITAEFTSSDKRKMATVFIPTTPNPTSGWFVVVPEEELRIIDMSVDDALKMIISGGVARPHGFNDFVVKSKGK